MLTLRNDAAVCRLTQKKKEKKKRKKKKSNERQAHLAVLGRERREQARSDPAVGVGCGGASRGRSGASQGAEARSGEAVGEEGLLGGRQKDVVARDSHVHMLDCGQSFLNKDGVDEELMQDGLHPSRKGMEALARCLAPAVALYVENRRAAEPGTKQGPPLLSIPRSCDRTVWFRKWVWVDFKFAVNPRSLNLGHHIYLTENMIHAPGI